MLSLPDFIEKRIVVSYPKYGNHISFKNDNLIIKDQDGNVLLQDTCHKIFSLWIVGSTTLTSGILQRSKKFGFSVFLISYSHRLYGLWNSETEGNYLLREKQYSFIGQSVGKHLIHNKIDNQRRLLQKVRKKEEGVKSAIKKLEDYKTRVLETEDYDTIMGLEGVASKVFFSHWYLSMGWHGRKPRTKIDFINTTLDIGYTYLFYFVECMLQLYGFDLYKGVYHRSFYQRKSLVCDIVEPFRCIIDNAVKKGFSLGVIKKENFTKLGGQYILNKDQNKAYTQWLMRNIMEHKSEIFKYVQAYYRAFIRNKAIVEYPTFKYK